jgi:hypothetical protein
MLQCPNLIDNGGFEAAAVQGWLTDRGQRFASGGTTMMRTHDLDAKDRILIERSF